MLVCIAGRLLASVTAAVKELFEEVPELCVEDGVEDGVEGTVDVAQPGDDAHQAGGDGAGGTPDSQGVHHKEGRPAQQEHTCRWEEQEGTLKN